MKSKLNKNHFPDSLIFKGLYIVFVYNRNNYTETIKLITEDDFRFFNILIIEREEEINKKITVEYNIKPTCLMSFKKFYEQKVNK